MLYGYARVSSETQSFDGQVEALQAAGCQEVYREKFTGKTAADRKQLQALLAKAQAGDAIVVTKLDRLGRSSRDLANLLHELKERGVEFRSLGDSIDTSTPVGRAMVGMLGVIAELERDLIRERCAAGLERAKARGVRLGRKHVLDPHQRSEVQRLVAEGQSHRSIARLLGVGKGTIQRLAEVPAA